MGLEKINHWKKERGLTNAELAKLSGVPKSTIDKITSGNTYDPKLETIKAIASDLGKTINDLDNEVNSDKEKKEPTPDEGLTQDIITILINKGIIQDGVPLSPQEQAHFLEYLSISAEAYSKLRK